MIQVTETTTISRSPGEVFAFLADLNNIPKWQTEVVTSKVLTTGPTRVGTRFTEDVKMWGPMRATANCEVTEFSPDGMMAFKAVSRVEEKDSGRCPGGRKFHGIGKAK